MQSVGQCLPKTLGLSLQVCFLLFLSVCVYTCVCGCLSRIRICVYVFVCEYICLWGYLCVMAQLWSEGEGVGIVLHSLNFVPMMTEKSME